jgi:hypothetical protein
MNYRDARIQKALYTLFGPTHNQPYPPEISLLKQAYRKQAMLFHPDRCTVTGSSEVKLEEKFKDLNNAYNLLISLIEGGVSAGITPKTHTAWTHRTRHFHTKQHSTYNYEKKVFKRQFKLRLAFFLYRKGIIDWNTAIEALIWQATNRPRVGEIGIRCRYLEREQIYHILRNRQPGERFLETARRRGLLDGFKTHVILYIQRSYNLPIGRYFVEKKIVSREELDGLVAELAEYNRRFLKK